MIRAEIERLISLGPFPASEDVNLEVIKLQHELLQTIQPPVSDEEARELLHLFGPDDYFGGAWTVLHLIEGAPGWPLRDCLEGAENEWIIRLRDRARRGGRL